MRYNFCLKKIHVYIAKWGNTTMVGVIISRMFSPRIYAFSNFSTVRMCKLYKKIIDRH